MSCWEGLAASAVCFSSQPGRVVATTLPVPLHPAPPAPRVRLLPLSSWWTQAFVCASRMATALKSARWRCKTRRWVGALLLGSAECSQLGGAPAGLLLTCATWTSALYKSFRCCWTAMPCLPVSACWRTSSRALCPCRPGAATLPPTHSPHPTPCPQARLEVLDAETEGQLGYILELELNNALRGREVAALLTQVRAAARRHGAAHVHVIRIAHMRVCIYKQSRPAKHLRMATKARLASCSLACRPQVVVDPADPAFSSPTKQVGPHYSKEVRGGGSVDEAGRCLGCLELRSHGGPPLQRAPALLHLPSHWAGTRPDNKLLLPALPACKACLHSPDSHLQEAEAYAAEKGWAVAPDGDTFRRVVASPLPRDIVEARAVQVLLQVNSWCWGQLLPSRPAGCRCRCCRRCYCFCQCQRRCLWLRPPMLLLEPIPPYLVRPPPGGHSGCVLRRWRHPCSSGCGQWGAVRRGGCSGQGRGWGAREGMGRGGQA